MNIITIQDDLINVLGNLSFNYNPSEDFKSLDEVF